MLRRLRYFDDRGNIDVHYKSRPVDYPAFTHEDFTEASELDDPEFCSFEEGDLVDPEHILLFAKGHESQGRDLFLDVLHAEVTEEAFAANRLTGVRIEEFFNNLKQAYRSLQLIPCPGGETVEADRVDERADEITEDMVRVQAEEWGTDLDIQYLRQLYRQHGWPDQFRKDDAKQAVHELLSSMEGRRGDWF